LFTINGKLSRTMDSRQTKNGWKIRDFIVELEPGTLHPQPRKFQAIKEAVDYLSDIPIGADVEVHFKMCGKQYKKEGETDYQYHNIDEAHKIYLLILS